MMKSLLASVRAGGGLDRVDHAVQLLEDEWRKHGEVPLDRLWTEQKRLLESNTDEPIILLAELIRTDLRCRFARGQTPTVAEYLGRFPDLNAADSRVLSLIYEEFCLNEERGVPLDVESFCDRYPRWKESLVSQLQYHHLFSQAAGVRPKVPPFPEPGDTFEEFQLLSLLGRGGTSRVFLARDLSLGGKRVVLKVSMDRGREPQAQGALDHPHIVPVNSVVFDDREMRGLSMPFRPGLPLDEIIRRVDPASRPRRAMAIWEALVGTADESIEPAMTQVREMAENRTAGPRGDGWDGFPVRRTFPYGAAWIVKVIAEALHYAHGAQTFHRDVKPANVLLTVQHGPQLLDFNLAESPHSASQAQAAMHGGTLPYMAPEQIEAFLNPDLWGKVGAKADIYSLGLVLRELLTGQAPDLPAETLAPARAMRVLLDRRPFLDVSVRRTNPDIPYALEAIVGRCLTVAPDDRYADAGALAEDLDRFLRRKPLAHAVNPSRRERYVNWTARNRFRLAVVAACVLPLAFLLIGMVAGRAMSTGRPSIAIEIPPTMADVLKSLDQGRPLKSIEILSRLKAKYPKSSIPRMYLSLAYDACSNDEDATIHFAEALGMPDARKELVAWSRNDPRLPDRLERFAENRFHKAQDIEVNSSLAESDRGDGEKNQCRLAREACKIALEIRPDSNSSTYKLAQAEVGLNEFESARRRADRAIELANESISSERATDVYTVAHKELTRRIFEWRRLRVELFTQLAGKSPDREEALKVMRLADEDIRFCDTFVDSHIKNIPDSHQLEKFRARALITRAEVDLDLGHFKDANEHFRHARATFQKYINLVDSVDPRYRDRKETDEKWNVRLHAIERRLQEEARKPGGDPAEGAR